MEHSSNQHSYHRAVVLTLGASVVVATVLAVYFASEAQRQASARELAARELSAAKSELASAQKRLAADRSPAVAIDSVAPAPDAALRPTPADTGADPTPRASTSPDRRSAFNSPAMREMVRQTRLVSLRPIYDPLLTQFNLSPEERERFYDLQVTVDDPAIGLDKMPSEAETPEERAQIENEIRQNRDAALQQLSSLLGGPGYQLYDSYRATQSERMLVQQFRQQIDPRSPQINDWQIDRLRDLLIQSRAQYPPINDDFSASYAAVLMQAAQILTPDQLASFRKYLQNQEDLRKTMRNVLTPGG